MENFNQSMRTRIRDDYLTCTICFNEYNTPKALPCLHTFCLECLRDYVVSRNYEADGKLPCPVCRTVTDIPQQGIQGFPDNHMIASLIADVDKNPALPAAPTIQAPQTDKPVPAPRSKSPRPVPAPRSPRSRSPNVVSTSTDGLPALTDQGAPVPAVPPRPSQDSQNHAASSGPTEPQRHQLNIGALITEGMGGVSAAVGNALSDISGYLNPKPASHGPQLVVPNPDPPRHSEPSSPFEYVPKNEGDGVHYHKYGGLYPNLANVYSGPCTDDQLLAFGRYGAGINNFLKPFGLAVSQNGEFVITDRGGSRIFVYTNNAEFKSRFNVDCVVNGVAVTKDNHLLLAVSKSGSAIMRLYTMEGRLLHSYGDYYKFDQSSGITITPSDYVAISNLAKDNVLIFTDQRKFSLNFGWKGSGDKHFKQPSHVAATSKNYVIVSDTGNHCLKLYDIGGNFKRSFGSHGSSPGQLDTPLGVACDADDNIIVADSNNHRVSVFTVKGGFYTTIVKHTDKIGPDVKPINVAVTPRNNIAVLLFGTGVAEVRVYNWRPNHRQGI